MEDNKNTSWKESNPSLVPEENNPGKIHPDYEQQILGLLRSSSSVKVLRDALNKYHASDVADALEKMNAEERDKLFKVMDTFHVAEVLEYADEKLQAICLRELNIRKTISILNEMEPDKVSRLLQDMPVERKEILLELLDPELRKDVLLIHSFGKDRIGSAMTTDYIELPKSISVKDAMRELKKQAKDTDELSILYVKDENGLYYGALRIQDLFSARANDNLEERIEVNFPFVYATEPIEKVLEELKDYSEDSIPVLNNENEQVGIITYSDLLEIFHQERDEDYARFAGLSSKEDLNETLFQSVKKRLPWLCLLLILALGVSAVTSMFEHVVASLTILMVFQSLILDMAGNVGTQTLSVTIRVLMDPSLTRKQRRFLIFKEARTGLINGLIVGVLSSLVLGIFIHFSAGYDWLHAYAIAFCIGSAMVCSMLISSLTGTCIPILFQSIHIDPAAASGPLITTLNDLIGVVTYYSFCWIFLIQILHI